MCRPAFSVVSECGEEVRRMHGVTRASGVHRFLTPRPVMFCFAPSFSFPSEFTYDHHASDAHLVSSSGGQSQLER